jgi:DNA-binding NtrC family response regulator
MPRPRILLVDDERGILELLATTLQLEEGLDVEVRTESDSRVAAVRLAQESYDLVVSDFRMPGVDGVEILSAARRRNPTGKRVLFTGYNEVPAEPARMAEAHMDLLLHKPIMPDAFVKAIRGLLASA